MTTPSQPNREEWNLGEIPIQVALTHIRNLEINGRKDRAEEFLRDYLKSYREQALAEQREGIFNGLMKLERTGDYSEDISEHDIEGYFSSITAETP